MSQMLSLSDLLRNYRLPVSFNIYGYLTYVYFQLLYFFLYHLILFYCLIINVNFEIKSYLLYSLMYSEIIFISFIKYFIHFIYRLFFSINVSMSPLSLLRNNSCSYILLLLFFEFEFHLFYFKVFNFSR